MEQVKVVFGSNWKPASIFIKLFTWSRWCHCGIVDGEYIIDTTLASGCRRILISEWVKHYDVYQVMDLPVKSKEGCLELARSYVGSAYDWLGILSYVLYKDFEDKNKFFCSELLAHCVGMKYKPWSISPAWLYKLAKTCKGCLYE
jgi:uncharacterized protein YycO